ncbi:MAG TPA: hypothetical protein VNT50_07115 [Microbacterium sp.]|uniref:hypothetical protein n=1 Tax=Microbacterium sp. TaxID=51671 RepID=UPI002BDD6E52|nr:hypothetical protein [Microbacterium sp.]HWI31243.1 hypothetical protein [Microbacterium sp.]
MDESAPAPKHSEMHELVAVILLSLVAVLTAWCGFESSKWGGDSSVAFSAASAARIEAADHDGQARDARGFDLAVYTQWVLAQTGGDTALADYIEERFSPEFAIAFDAWQADGEQESGPFRMPEYVPPGTEEAAEATARADASTKDALDFNEKGDNYSLMTVMFALVLFLAAIAQRGISVLATRLVLGLAGGLALIGLVVLLTFPIRL